MGILNTSDLVILDSCGLSHGESLFKDEAHTKERISLLEPLNTFRRDNSCDFLVLILFQFKLF